MYAKKISVILRFNCGFFPVFANTKITLNKN